jgi:hypothetical protein
MGQVVQYDQSLLYNKCLHESSKIRLCCSYRYCVLCPSNTFSRLVLSLCLPKSAKACTAAAIIANERLVNHFTEYGYVPHQAHFQPFQSCVTTHYIGVKYVGHAHTEHFATPLKSLCTISTEWED